MKKIELLAPAGDLQRAKVAIHYGADAIYLGGKKYSLRSRASNFDLSDIAEICDYAKNYGAHVHVTVNMIPHEGDLDGIEEYLIQLEECGVTAIIVASMAIVSIAKRVAPSLEIHLSTQMSTTNSKSIEFFKQMGVDRVVLARECSLDDIHQISKVSELPLEVFIHGGMCVNYSGRCTLSNAMTYRDANRGGCAQSCRWKYHFYAGAEKVSDDDILFSMSSKDLMAYKYIPDLLRNHVASLKIEGRMKSMYYIATLVKTYRQLIDEIDENNNDLSEERINYYANEFSKAENRPTSFGFLNNLPSAKDHLYGVNGAGVTHDFVGVVLNYDKESQLAKIQVRNVIRLNDELEVFGPTITNEALTIEQLFDSDMVLMDVANQPMNEIYIKIPFECSEGDMIRKRKKYDI